MSADRVHRSGDQAVAGRKQVTSVRIRVEGVVQGVGFRPFVYRLAVAHGLYGRVWNEAGLVVIQAAGEPGAIESFTDALRREAPAASVVERLHVERTARSRLDPPGVFRIAATRGARGRALGVGPDLATCPACLREVLNPAEPRYQYPFTNCTDCGPRLSILEGTPYDRPTTTMAPFRMCPGCQREYDDPADRRFHAEPNACHACGPRARLLIFKGGLELAAWPAIRDAFWRIIRGRGSVAIKGTGGYHLACLASDEVAVSGLRERKRRPDKPFAIMAASLAVLRQHCIVTAAEAEALSSPSAPILLLRLHHHHAIAPSVAPRQHRIGAMLPYTPLHHLLFAGEDEVLVMTSGNLADEPQITDDGEAEGGFYGIADAMLRHDRRIAVRVDDSVARLDGRTFSWLRLGRGKAPLRLPAPNACQAAPDVIALGAQLKTTFCLKRADRLILAQHIGDLERPANREALAASLRHYLKLYKLYPERIAIDLHPEVGSAGLAAELAAEEGAELIRVQHHHAHAVACLAEHRHPPDAGPVLSVVMDGLGYGPDGTLWGFEFLAVDYTGYRRLAHLRPVPMPGGEAVIREPWRIAFSHLATEMGISEISALRLFRHRSERELGLLSRAMERGINAPLTSSCGRLFDAVAALAGVCLRPSYEGQAAAELEAALWRERRRIKFRKAYRLEIAQAGLPMLDPRPLLRAVVDDVARGRSPGEIAAGFHVGLVHAILAMVEHLADQESGFRRQPLVLSGGVFTNGFLLRATRAVLARRGFRVLSHRQLPANDGGVAVGQAVIAAASATGTISRCA